MIEIRCSKKSGVLSVKAEGHSFFASHGKDPVCAAVSVLLQNWLAGEEVLLNANVQKHSLESGLFWAEVLDYKSDELLLFHSLLLGLRVMEKDNPKNMKVTVED